MSKLLSACLLIFFCGALYADPVRWPMPVPEGLSDEVTESKGENKVLAALLTGFVGFGTGHMVLDAERKKVFAYGELAAVAVAGVGGALQLSGMNQDSEGGDDVTVYLGLGLLATGAVSLAGLRIWEVVDMVGILTR